MRKKLYLPLLLTLGLLACAGPDPFAPLVPDSLYTCDNARQLTISIGDQSERAIILYNGRSIPLWRTESERGVAYSNNIFTLYHDDNLAFVEREGTPLLTNCRPYAQKY